MAHSDVYALRTSEQKIANFSNIEKSFNVFFVRWPFSIRVFQFAYFLAYNYVLVEKVSV